VVLVSSGWAASPAAIDSGESRSRHGLYAFPSTGGGFIQMTVVSIVRAGHLDDQSSLPSDGTGNALPTAKRDKSPNGNDGTHYAEPPHS